MRTIDIAGKRLDLDAEEAFLQLPRGERWRLQELAACGRLRDLVLEGGLLQSGWCPAVERLCLLTVNVRRLRPPEGLRELQLLYCTGWLAEFLEQMLQGSTLHSLRVSGLGVEWLPLLPATLTELRVTSRLTRLPPLPTGLQVLHVDGNCLRELPPLPKGLQVLNCSSNPLRALPALPAGLRVLDASFCSLEIAPELPPGLRLLSIDRIDAPLPEFLLHLSAPPSQFPAQLPVFLQKLRLRRPPTAPLPPLPRYLMDIGPFVDNQEVNSGRRAAASRQQDRARALLVLERRLRLAVPDVGSILVQFL